MKKLILFVLLLMTLAACGGDAPIEERIIGEWSGLQTSTNGEKVPATWEFLEGGTMIVKIGTLSYGAEWSVEGNRVNIATERFDYPQLAHMITGQKMDRTEAKGLLKTQMWRLRNTLDEVSGRKDVIDTIAREGFCLAVKPRLE